MDNLRQTKICTLEGGWKAVCKPTVQWTDHRIPHLLYSIRSPHLPRCLGVSGPPDEEQGAMYFDLNEGVSQLPLHVIDPPQKESCFLFEYLEGSTLRQLNQKTITSAEWEQWFDKIVGALAWIMLCAGKPFAHLDLSPENILISASGAAALIDFSGSRFLDGDTSLPVTSRVATAGYAAHEVYFGDLCPETDLYGLAMTVLAAYSGQTASSLTQSKTRNTLKKLDRHFSERLRLCLSDDPFIRRQAVVDTSYEYAISKVAVEQPSMRLLSTPAIQSRKQTISPKSKKSKDEGVLKAECESSRFDCREHVEDFPQVPHNDDDRCPYSFSNCPFLEVAHIICGE